MDWEEKSVKLAQSADQLSLMFPVLQVSSAASLTVVCSDLHLYESLVSRDQFGTLPSLNSLSIQFCKIKVSRLNPPLDVNC